ncbi:HET-domain-containing protein, partial [Lophium mytilinum]
MCESAWHHRCNEWTVASMAAIDKPKRLICVGSQDHAPFLYEPSLEYPNTKYIALSHCWGKVQPMRTLQGNIKDMRKSIPWMEMPKTFQDTITIARKLGIEYAWIDSLCIVQDDLDDWAKESSKMGDIYSGAYLTIAAAAAHDSSAGFLGARQNLTKVVSLRLKGSLKAHDIHVRPRLDSLGKGPLQDRGWAFQERILSPRILRFLEHEMEWECHSARCCECESRILFLSERLPMHYTSNTDSTYFWGRDFVADFSRLKLTQEMDTLPALSGIAASYREVTAEDYLAGLWKTHLAPGLLWRSKTPGTLPTSWRAPSWSWASV